MTARLSLPGLRAGHGAARTAGGRACAGAQCTGRLGAGHGSLLPDLGGAGVAGALDSTCHPGGTVARTSIDSILGAAAPPAVLAAAAATCTAHADPRRLSRHRRAMGRARLQWQGTANGTLGYAARPDRDGTLRRRCAAGGSTISSTGSSRERSWERSSLRVVPDFVDSMQETIKGGARTRDEVNRRGLTRG